MAAGVDRPETCTSSQAIYGFPSIITGCLRLPELETFGDSKRLSLEGQEPNRQEGIGSD